MNGVSQGAGSLGAGTEELLQGSDTVAHDNLNKRCHLPKNYLQHLSRTYAMDSLQEGLSTW